MLCLCTLIPQNCELFIICKVKLLFVVNYYYYLFVREIWCYIVNYSTTSSCVHYRHCWDKYILYSRNICGDITDKNQEMILMHHVLFFSIIRIFTAYSWLWSFWLIIAFFDNFVRSLTVLHFTKQNDMKFVNTVFQFGSLKSLVLISRKKWQNLFSVMIWVLKIFTSHAKGGGYIVFIAFLNVFSFTVPHYFKSLS